MTNSAGGKRDSPRKFSPSEPLLPQTIAFIRSSLHRHAEYQYEQLPNVFVVFGASVSFCSISTKKNYFFCNFFCFFL
jgi:hypothetical protein